MKKNVLQKLFVIILCLVLMMCSSTAYGSLVVADVSNDWESKVDPIVLSMIESGATKIPVWLWMEDINHEEAQEQVYRNTGLNENNLSVIDEKLTDELTIRLENYTTASANNSSPSDFQAYLCDVNGDMLINTTDALKVQQIINGTY